MGWLDLLPWPAMAVTVGAAWALVALQVVLVVFNLRGAKDAESAEGEGP